MTTAELVIGAYNGTDNDERDYTGVPVHVTACAGSQTVKRRVRDAIRRHADIVLPDVEVWIYEPNYHWFHGYDSQGKSVATLQYRYGEV